MLYSHKHRFVYMAPPKTGTTSLCTVLRADYDSDYWDFTGFDPVLVRGDKDDPSGHIWPRHIIHMPKELEGYFVFASIRNPYRHTMSQYSNACRTRGKDITMAGFHKYLAHAPLEEFSLYEFLHRNEDYEPPERCIRFYIDRYIDTEKITEGFNSLPFVKSPIRMPHYKRSGHKLFYTEEMAQLAFEKKRIDFDYFGYDSKLPEDLCSS